MKRKKFFTQTCILLALLMLFSASVFVPVSAADAETVQDTVVDATKKTYRIYTAKGLQRFATDISALGNDTYHGWSIYLEADVDLNPGWIAGSGAAPVVWTPINNFKGEFYGQGHTVSGMYVSTAGNAGFFSSAYDATVRDLLIRNSYFASTANMAVGSVIGWTVTNNYGTTSYLTNIYSDATVVCSASNSNKGFGGIVGLQGESVQYSNVVFAGSVSSYEVAGGIVGKNTKTAVLKDCINLGTVSATNRECAGIVGYITADATLTGCLNSGKINAPGAGASAFQYVGGIAYLRGSGTYTVALNDCYYDADFHAYGKGVGVAYWSNATQAGDFALTVSYHGTQTGTWTKAWNSGVQGSIGTLPETADDILSDSVFAAWSYVDGQLMPGVVAEMRYRLPATAAYVQQSTQNSDIRIIGLFNGALDAYQTVGFRVSVTVDGSEKLTRHDIRSSAVYRSVLASEDIGIVSYNAQELGADYIYALEIAGIPSTGTVLITVRSFAEDFSGNQTFDRVVTVTVTDGSIVPAGAVPSADEN